MPRAFNSPVFFWQRLFVNIWTVIGGGAFYSDMGVWGVRYGEVTSHLHTGGKWLPLSIPASRAASSVAA